MPDSRKWKPHWWTHRPTQQAVVHFLLGMLPPCLSTEYEGRPARKYYFTCITINIVLSKVLCSCTAAARSNNALLHTFQLMLFRQVTGDSGVSASNFKVSSRAPHAWCIRCRLTFVLSTRFPQNKQSFFSSCLDMKKKLEPARMNFCPRRHGSCTLI